MTIAGDDGRLFGEAATALAAYASGLLGWRPGEFWNSTPGELETALGIASETEAAMDRCEMDRLAKLFPDNRER